VSDSRVLFVLVLEAQTATKFLFLSVSDPCDCGTFFDGSDWGAQEQNAVWQGITEFFNMHYKIEQVQAGHDPAPK